MTPTSSTLRRRAVALLAGTAIAVLASAAPAFAEPGSDADTYAASSSSTETLGKKKPPPPPPPPPPNLSAEEKA
ncbi:hypothetical protein MGALJ_12130 [Mycobacterium gallinarum]|uniref:Fibronectin attachment protein n=1 Tax=Mycobacterium gallinarum TaxID=39689 RepID=A0A9W4BFP8_9MYCO|nr:MULTISPECIES: hypothetical protein [Mycobacterium]MDV3136361.1 hypothetical protein [Mycobacterium sp. 29Ha]BBY91544.1 hypothetical protein MGALJ_12130 [Mycobacterium gallinarum]